ncbi:AsmA family protein [Anianabacter salinae]|uniref:AsmA family protein n=1 Tax=Anianabacter salinae TaxID=2851023 RepID=UPI00225E022B|nr:AsmA family protein [Anianabacter salinae]MBV0912651.1 AsmA family protein [Anianabacter salinae]
MRWILRIAFALVGLVVAAVVLLFLLPADRIAALAEQRFEAATGRTMTLSGGVSPTVWPVLGVETGPVEIANAEWSDEGPLLRAEGLKIGVDAAALIRGEVRIREVTATAPAIILERAADGTGNWEIGAAEPEAAPTGDPAQGEAGEAGQAPASGPRFFSLDVARISDGAILYIDRRDGSRSSLTDIDAVVELPDFNGIADLDFAATMNGQRIDTVARIEGLSTFLANGAVPVSVRGTLGSADVDFTGRAGLAPLAASGRIDADLGDLSGPFAILGMTPPGLPQGMGRTVALTGDITYTAQTLNIRDASVTLDQNRIALAADIALGARPKVTAQVTAGDLDLSALGGGNAAASSGGGSGTGGQGGQGGQGTTSGPTGWPTDRIDVSALQAVDLDLSLNADSLDLGMLQFGAARLVTQLADGRAVTEIQQLAGYGGGLSGSLVVNSRGGLSTRAALTGRDIDMNALLMALADLDRIDSSGDFSVNLLGVGNSVDTLMKSLEGDASLQLTGGEIRGIDLDRMLRNLDPSAVGPNMATPVETASATFAVAGGTARTEDLRLVTPAASASGRGTIGLGAQTIDMRIIPSLLDGQDDINVPVVITGPWSGPRVSLDLAAAAQEEIQEELDNLRGQAETEIRNRIGQELGVEAQEGETAEQILQRGLEERATEGLNNLLGDLLGGN